MFGWPASAIAISMPTMLAVTHGAGDHVGAIG